MYDSVLYCIVMLFNSLLATMIFVALLILVFVQVTPAHGFMQKCMTENAEKLFVCNRIDGENDPRPPFQTPIPACRAKDSSQEPRAKSYNCLF